MYCYESLRASCSDGTPADVRSSSSNPMSSLTFTKKTHSESTMGLGLCHCFSLSMHLNIKILRSESRWRLELPMVGGMLVALCGDPPRDTPSWNIGQGPYRRVCAIESA